MLDLLIFGDIHTVLSGSATEKTLIDIDLSLIPYALGSGANGSNLHLIGETIVFDYQAHICLPQVQNTAAFDKIVTVLHTPFLMGISRKPSDMHKLDNPISVADLYRKLLVKYPDGFAIVGDINFAILEATYLKRSPIFGENINEKRDIYWEHEEKKDRQAHIFGIILPHLNEKAFYANPLDTKTDLYSHTHALTSMGPRHLLTQSTMVNGTFYVEAVS